ncbi:LysR family transcriptional regulator [Nesterenkonia xinjiangensis]|uniref:DNA-binding transcriptional LysR family regulator n=1 Tax=Nesterenkonia xinjiangensis TaxID=225327 RepID=A0A7Z0GMI6_9MICC|nr:LysR family transcriptional regulator [Nesterenkonia xinjiangensis]NYJ78735.1 DNA-binding transcriptional LysR family regulator [Nesterenkonia xinjiangensis]
MDSRLLRYFVAVAEEGSVSAAADALHITQPALSRQIRSLEHSLGLTLFDRGELRLRLTPEGREFLGTARTVLQAHAHARDFADRLASGRLRKVSLAAPRTTLIDVVAPFVATFTTEDPVPSVVEIGGDEQPHRLVADHDLVIAPQSPGEDVDTRLIAELPVWAYVPASHRWAGREEITLEELTEEQLVVTSADFKARRLLDAALDLADLTPRSVLEVRHGRVAQALAAAGRGAGVVTDDPHFDLVPVRIRTGPENSHRPLHIRLHASWRRGHHAAESLEGLVARLRAFSLERYGRTIE